MALALSLPAAASAAPTAVDVRIEGKVSTIFSAPVTTDGKAVTTPSGGTHPCDGTNNGVSPVPAPTATSALDDAAIKGGFSWDGTWSGPSYPDYFVTRVASESESPADGHFWGVFVNGVATTTGGCQALVKAGDEVLWTYDAFNKPGGALRLTAPASIQIGQAALVSVTNIETGAPVAGATVGSAVTGPDGTAALTFADPGVYVLKADRPDAIRSREARVCVDPPLVEACTSSDRTAPTVENTTASISSSATRFDYVRVSWLGDDGATGSGIRRYRVEQRRVDVPDKPWVPLVTDEPITEKRARGQEGETYEFRVQAFDRAGNSSGWVSQVTSVPFDNLSSKLKLSKRGWKTLRRHGAFKRSVSRSTLRGATASIRFTGSRATLVTRKLRNGGRLRVTVDGSSKVVSLRGRGRFRRKLVATKPLSPGEHTLRVTSLGRAPIEIDAVAIRP
ncbi:MAG TPA: DUF4430 domain-containing protein [Thermoleophilaceae bacterium]|nr:DUF4430 domain-containing protein [Thermoleophilaceae bacterium]